MPLVEGALLHRAATRPTSPKVIIVDEKLARHFWGRGQPDRPAAVQT